MLSMLTLIAWLTKKLNVPYPIGPPSTYRNDVVHMEAVFQRRSAIAAAAALCDQKFGNFFLRVSSFCSTFSRHSVGIMRPRHLRMFRTILSMPGSVEFFVILSVLAPLGVTLLFKIGIFSQFALAVYRASFGIGFWISQASRFILCANDFFASCIFSRLDRFQSFMISLIPLRFIGAFCVYVPDQSPGGFTC